MADDEDMGDPIEDNEEPEKMQVTPLKEFLALLKGGREQIVQWYDEYNQRPPRFESFLQNMSKNRYPNVILYDHSRVILKDKYDKNDYIHASWVDSFDRRSGYILCQAPFDDYTDRDFWRMCTMVKPLLIIVLTATHAGEKRLIRQFWPTQHTMKDVTGKGGIMIKCANMENERDHDRYEIIIEEAKKAVASPPLLQYNSWTEDRKLPDNLLEFRASVKIAVACAMNKGKKGEKTEDKEDKKEPTVGPVLLVCPSGVHRSGTFAGLDIILERIGGERKVGLAESVTLIREQRYGAFTHFDHYAGIADIMLRHVVSSNMVSADTIGKGKG